MVNWIVNDTYITYITCTLYNLYNALNGPTQLLLNSTILWSQICVNPVFNHSFWRVFSGGWDYSLYPLAEHSDRIWPMCKGFTYI